MADQAERVPEGLAVVQAKDEDITAIKAMVNSAYSKYVNRIGGPPAPMTTDWDELQKTQDIWVLLTTENQEIVGSIVLSVDAEADSIRINNLVVDEAAQGRGYGRVLMNYAEDTARAKGRNALTLFTNTKMYENLALYPKMGFHETERKREAGYSRVYYRKDLS